MPVFRLYLLTGVVDGGLLPTSGRLEEPNALPLRRSDPS